MRPESSPTGMFARLVQGRGRFALAAVLALPLQATEPEPRLPGLETVHRAGSAPAPGLPYPSGAGEDGDPGPPAKDPEERIEPDPSWSRPAGTPAPRPAHGPSDEIMTTLRVPAREFKEVIRMVGTSLERGKLLSFFQTEPRERFGTVKYFYNEEIFQPPMRHLTWGKNGSLFWLHGTSPAVKFMTPTGVHAAIPLGGNQAIHYLGQNAQGHLAFFGDGNNGILDTGFPQPGSSRMGPPRFDAVQPTDEPIRLAFPSPKGGFWVMGENTIRYKHANGSFTPAFPHPFSGATGFAASPDGSSVVGFGPDPDRVFRMVNLEQPWVFDLPQGSRPHAVAPGPNGQTWITLEGTDEYVIVEPKGGEIRTMRLTPSPRGPRGLRALTLGPDGNMWMVMARTGGLLRMTPQGDFNEFGPLPNGDVPVDLVPTADGLLFTLENSCRIGFFRVLPAAGADPQPSGAQGSTGWAWPIPEPRRPERKKQRTRAEAQALHAARIRRAEERRAEYLREEAEARLLAPESGAGEPKEAQPPPAPGAGERKEASTATPAPGAGERKEARPATPPAAAGPDPSGILAGLGVDLAPDDLKHILNCHSFGKRPHKSQFFERHSSPEAMTRLLARGLAESGAIGRIIDARGVRYTKCEVPNVGRYKSFGQWVDTDHFVVVTEYNQELDEHGISTAFPVPRHW